MEDNITELKKICENLDVLKNNLFHIFLFYKGESDFMNLRKLQKNLLLSLMR